jgi:hypothetical protein
MEIECGEFLRLMQFIQATLTRRVQVAELLGDKKETEDLLKCKVLISRIQREANGARRENAR